MPDDDYETGDDSPEGGGVPEAAPAPAHSRGKAPDPNRLTPEQLLSGNIPGLTDVHPNGMVAPPQGSKGHAMQAVIAPDGTVGSVPVGELQQAIDAGFSIADGETFRRAELQAKYGDTGGQFAAAGIGAARGLTLGLSDPLAIGAAGLVGGKSAADATREYMAGVAEANPYASGAGEIAGAVAPLLLSGGTSAAASGAEAASGLARAGEVGASALRTAGAIPRGVSAVGELAERGAAKVLGEEATGLGARLLQKGVSMGVRGAAEGALYGIGQQISESSLGNEELTGQKLLAAAGHGALLGGTLSSAIGMGGELSRAVVGRMGSALQGQAEEQAFRSINARKAFTEEASKIPGGTKALGRTLLDDGLVQAGDTVADIAPRITAAKEAAGQAITDVVQQVDTKGVKVADVLTKLEERAREFDQKLGYETAAKEIRAQSRNLGRMFGVFDDEGLIIPGALDNEAKLSDLLKARRDFEGTIDWRNDKVLAQGKKAFGRTLEDAVVEHGDKVAQETGGTFRKEYEAAKLKYRQLAVAEKAADDAVDRASANASHSLTDKLFAAHGFGAGMAAHGALGGGLMGMATGAASKLIRTRGNATAAVVLDKLSALRRVEAAAQRVDTEIDRAVSGALSPGKHAAPRIKTPTDIDGGATTAKEKYAARVASVARAAAQAEDHASHIQAAVQHIEPHAPTTAAAFQSASLRATNYLASQVPSGHLDMGKVGLTPQLAKPRVSDAEMAKFNRQFEAVHDPVTVLHAMAKGTMTRDQVDALKAVYPDLYKDMQQRVMKRLPELKTQLPYAQRLKVGMFLDVPADATMTPAFLSTMQATYESKPANGNGGGNGPPPSNAPKHPLPDRATDNVSLGAAQGE